jgi:aspartyl-tRNA(Asn)/glutamyl-tRNA(Gln) amidotransferase subunit B
MNSYSKPLFGKNKDWEVVIGLEIHAQIQSESKLFSGASTKFGGDPNNHVALFDAAIPGTLPILNSYCIEQAVKTGLAINGDIQNHSIFDRKHYFYQDLPSGYQISQFYNPIVRGGEVSIQTDNGSEKIVLLDRIHIEQDAGKSIHDLDPKFTYVDLNRAGVALMEIVSNPEISSPQEAVNYIKKLQLIMRYIGSCDGNMELGNLRCDANVSVKKISDTELGTRCEIKNLNSTRNIELAIKFEIDRQIKLLENGKKVKCQTLLFDVNSGETKVLRDKENSGDYRYFPDGDLLPVNLTDEYISIIKKSLPKLPDEKKKEYINYIDMARYFEEVLSNDITPKAAINWINVELPERMKTYNISSFDDLPESLNAKNLSEFLKLIENCTINGKIAKDVLNKMFQSSYGENKQNLTAKEIIEKEGLAQVIDEDQIKLLISKVLSENPDKVSEYKSGKEKLFDFFIGQIMKESKDKANPELTNKILRELLQVS